MYPYDSMGRGFCQDDWEGKFVGVGCEVIVGESSLSIHLLCNGEKTQKLWKPLLTQFSPEEAHRSGRCNEADEVIAASPSSLRTIE